MPKYIDMVFVLRNVNWSSPEVLNDGVDHPINQRADVWSLTLVIFEILSGEIPFDSPEYRNLHFDDFRTKLRAGLRPPIPDDILAREPWIADLVSSFSSRLFFRLLFRCRLVTI
jgi:serine/threonine protein kinase